MRLVVLIALASSLLPAGVVTADQISIDVGPAELVHNVLGPGSVTWRVPVIVSARLTNSGADPVYLDGIGGGSSLYPPTQIHPDGIIAAGAFVAGPMFAADLAALFTDGPNLADQQVIDGVSGSAYGIYRLNGSPLENDWLIPPPALGIQPPVTVRRSTSIPTVESDPFDPVQNEPGPMSTPEPSTFGLAGLGLAAAAFRALRRRALNRDIPYPGLLRP